MRPLTVLLGIIMGSSVAMSASLAMTSIVFLLLGDYYAARLHYEVGPLLRGLLWSWSSMAISATAFYGQIHQRPWRTPALAAVLLLLIAIGIVFWPR